MYHKIALLVMALLMVMMLGSCSDQKFRNDQQQGTLSQEEIYEGALKSVSALSDSLAALHQQVRVLKEQAQGLATRCDSVTNENLALAEENVELKAQLAQAREEVIPSMRQQYEGLFAMQQQAYQKIKDKLEATARQLSTTQSKCSAVQAERDRLGSQLNQLKPWALKWLHDSQRSFIKVMFGAGKAPIPDVEQPQLE